MPAPLWEVDYELDAGRMGTVHLRGHTPVEVWAALAESLDGFDTSPFVHVRMRRLEPLD